ncbi:Hypothetical predicted protein [Cloeon dipterum]|uniref:Uncharacterized protein n=1 Tax=Cloeon dipterum TaxID=197152 RepID=A0A8S1CGQ9_9INSE|nr:Hypothetical predicted protein [Cloeon dipterum]
MELNPLHVAAKTSDVEHCRRLVEDEGADVGAVSGNLDATAMHCAALNTLNGKQIVEYLTSLGLKADLKDSEGQEPIHYAVRARNFEVAKKLLKIKSGDGAEEGKNNLLHYFVKENNFEFVKIVHESDRKLIKEKGECGKTAFHLAAQHSDLEVCRWLAGNGVNFNVRDDEKCTAMHYAALRESDHREFVRCFTGPGTGALMYTLSKGKMSPLHYAFQHGRRDMAEELIDRGADLRAMIIDLTNVMHFCVKINDLDAVKMLHAKDKFLIFEKGKRGRTVMHHAAMHADLQMIQWLDKNDISLTDRDVFSYRASVLHFVAFNRRSRPELEQIVKYFVQGEVDVNGLTGNGCTPLHFAIKEKNSVVAEELVKHGADLELELKDLNFLLYCAQQDFLFGAKLVHKNNPRLITGRDPTGRTALHIAAEFSDLEFCKWLVAEDADLVNALTNKGSNALHLAAKNKKHGGEIVRFLISLHVPVNGRTKFQLVPLHFALQHGNMDAAHELVSLGADLTTKVGNLLHFCAWKNSLEGAKFVHLNNPALIKERGVGGKNALHIAVEFANAKLLCEWLVSQGVNPQERTDKGETALDLAAKRRDKDVRHYLESLGLKKRGILTRLLSKNERS